MLSLVEQFKSLDWAGRQAQFHSKAEATLLRKVRQYIAVLLEFADVEAALSWCRYQS